MRRWYIFAANYAHAVHCAKEYGLKIGSANVIYVSDHRLLLGITKTKNVEFIFYDTFPDHLDYFEIIQRVRVIESISGREEDVMEQPTDTFWWKLVHLDPALIRGLVMAGVLVASSLGILISPDVPNSFIGFIAALLAIIQAVWTRQAVTPNAKVAVIVPDPINAPGIVKPGNAVTDATPAAIIDAARASGN
jgi:hypothetical protein